MILDAYAVVAFLRDEPAAGEVAQLLASNEDVALTALGAAEVLDRLVRLGPVEDEALLDLARLGLTEPEPLDAGAAAPAGLLRAVTGFGEQWNRIRRYGAGGVKLNDDDCGGSSQRRSRCHGGRSNGS